MLNLLPFGIYLHRELSTEIELMLTTTILPDRCRLVVEETVPKGMYVDPDQLRDISEFTGLRTFVNGGEYYHTKEEIF